MNKWLATGVISVVALMAAGPYITGTVAQKKLASLVQLLDKQPHIRASIDKYERSYLGARVEILLQPEPATDADAAWRVVASLKYGVASLNAQAILQLPPQLQQDLHVRAALQNRPPVSVRAAASLLGVDMFLRSAPVTYSKEGVTAAIAPVELRLDAPVTMDAVGAQVQWNGLTMKSGGEEFLISKFQLQQNSRKLTSHLWVGDLVLALENFEWRSPGTDLRSSGMEIRSTTQKTRGSRLKSELLVATNTLVLDDKTFHDQRLKLEVEGLAIDELENLIVAVERRDAAMAKVTTERPDREQMKQQEKLTKAVANAGSAFLRKGLSIAVPEMQSTTPFGPLAGQGSLVQPAMEEADKAPLLTRTQGTMSFSMPLQLLMLLPHGEEQVAALIEQNLMVQEGEYLKAEATLGDSMIVLNGQQIPVPPLL